MSQLPADSATVTLPRHPTLSIAYLERKTRSQFLDVCQGIDLKFTYDGQGALYQVFSSLRRNGRRYALLPAFHCPTVVEPAIRAGLTPRFYRINEDLSIDYRSFEDGLGQDVAAALVIGYFGFPPDVSTVVGQCHESGVVLIEDCAHSFLNANPTRLSGDRGDIAIYSFKKTVPSQVGGGIRRNSTSIILSTELNRPPFSDALKNIKRVLDDTFSYSTNTTIRKLGDCLARARRTLRHSQVTSDDTNRQAQVRKMHFDYPFRLAWANSKIPLYAMQILKMSALDRVITARRRNFQILQSRLRHIRQIQPVFSDLGESVCPWSFPVLIRNRSNYDLELQQLGVPLFTFGETLHSKLLDGKAASPDAIESARFLSSRILCFSIHQGISDEWQCKLADIIVEYFDQQ